jgi:hypothetical protein
LVVGHRSAIKPKAVNMDGCSGLDAPLVLDLIEARAYADGAVLHGYRPATGLSSG